jgi:hypothetical protein
MRVPSVLLLTTAAFLLARGPASAYDDVPVLSRNPEIVDVPTAEVVDHYGYRVSFRFGTAGAVQNKTAFGVFPRLNIGFGLDSEGLIGTGDARLNKPTINVKFRIFDGYSIIPAIALGWDGQGYVWNKQLDEYEQRERGLYAVGTSEFLVRNLQIHFGGNISDFNSDESNDPRAFAGVTYSIPPYATLMAEYDNIRRYDERRINYGLRWFLSPNFTVDLAGRNIPEHVGTKSRITERIVKLNYSGSF